MKCPVCNENIPDNGKFCPYCGYKITEKDKQQYAEFIMEHPELAQEPDFEKDYDPIRKPVGSWFGGIMLGLFLNIFGVMIAIATRGRNTKRGAGIGFLVSTGAFVFWIIMVMNHKAWPFVY